MRLTLLACLGILLGTAASGLTQDPAKPAEKPKEPFKVPENFAILLPASIEKKLALNAEQREQVSRLGDEFREKSVAVRDKVETEVEKIRAAAKKAGTENDRATRRKLNAQSVEMVISFQKLRAEYQPRLRAVFTDDQKQKYDDLLRELNKPPAEKKPIKPPLATPR